MLVVYDNQEKKAFLDIWYSKDLGCYIKLIDKVLNKRYCACSSLGCVKHWIECSFYERDMFRVCSIIIIVKHRELTYTCTV